MAIAHVCLNCGRDLARVHPQREPHYGLALVTCPNCATACVRREHPVWRGWKNGRRSVFAIGVLAARLFISALLSLLNVLAIFMSLFLWAELQRVDRGGTPQRIPPQAAIFLAFAYGLLAPLTGVWLTAGFEHIARWKMWIAWLGWMTLILLVISLHGPLSDEIDPRGWSNWRGPMPEWILEGVLYIVVPGMVFGALLLVAALPGMLVGRGLLWLTGTVRRSRWRTRYRKAHLTKNVAWE
jgi:hypothetical protein